MRCFRATFLCVSVVVTVCAASEPVVTLPKYGTVQGRTVNGAQEFLVRIRLCWLILRDSLMTSAWFFLSVCVYACVCVRVCVYACVCGREFRTPSRQWEV